MPTVELAAGPIEYEDTGGDGPVVVLTHGLTIDSSVWRHVVPRLAPAYRCVTPTLPLGSHRRPMGPGVDLTLPGMVAIVADLLDALDLRDVTLVANDWGGTALLPALGRGERVAAMALVACEAFDNYPPGAAKVLEPIFRVPGGAWLFLQLMRTTPARRAPGGWGWMSKRPVPSGVVGQWFTPARVDPAIRRDLVHYALGTPPRATLLEWYERLRAFAGPVLVVWAREDRMMPREHGPRLAALFARGEVVELDDTYTLVPEDAPGPLADALLTFLARGDPSLA